MFNKISSFVSQHKKAALLLILLTSTALVACDRNSTDSSGAGSSSSAGSSAVSSSEEFNGSEVPNWDLENPTISTASTGLDIGLDIQYFGRYEGDYILYTGIKKFEGSTNTSVGYRTYVVINQKTGTEFFRWQLDPGTTYATWAVANNTSMAWGNDRYTIEGNTLYGSLWIYPQQGSSADSLLAGDYEPFIDYIDANFSTKYQNQINRYARQYRFVFKADLTSKAITILGASDIYEYEIQDIFADQETLYTTLSVYKNSTSPNPYATLFPLPNTVPTLTPNNNRYSVLYRLNLSDLSLIGTNIFSATTELYPYLNNIRRGFDVVNFDKEGNLFININLNINVQNRADIATKVNALDTNVLDATQLTALKADSIPVLQNYYDLISEETSVSSLNFNIGISGGYNVTTGLYDYFLANNNVWSSNNQTSEYYEGNRWQQYFEYEDESYVIENDRLIIRPSTQTMYNWYSYPSVFNTSKIYRINLETQEKTLLLDYENEGVFLTGIYRYTQGFYVTGVYNESPEFTTGLGKAEAFLRAYNTSFTKTGEIVLSGSEDDVGQGIILDETNKPVWLVVSNSTDGDFAEVGASNTTNTYRQYYVRFN